MKTLALLLMLSVFCASLGAEPPAARLAVTSVQRRCRSGSAIQDFTSQVRTSACDNIAFAPQYPLWSDGTSKRRWIYLPPALRSMRRASMRGNFRSARVCGKSSAMTARVETRFIERLADGSWRFAAYVWNKEGTDACLRRKTVRCCRSAPRPAVVTSFRRATIASRAMKARRAGARLHALQLSPDRDPLAPHAEPARNDHANLSSLVASGRCATCRRV